ncbi:membrane-associated, eicosanoid/glutathione metabolism protein [Hypoxylon sp. NC1633]|nr:membrane-associated, eicosanoid/glutathione metabolism protein [Hypoxylon sp. NC1633]
MAVFADMRLPVTGAFALPFAGYFLILSLRVSFTRIAKQIAMGDTIRPASPSPREPSSSSSHSSTTDVASDPLFRAVRAHQNFAETVPLALVLAGVAELNGAGRRPLAWALATLLLLRVLHAEFGLMRHGAMGLGRPVGFYGSMAVVGWLGAWGSWLVLRGEQ